MNDEDRELISRLRAEIEGPYPYNDYSSRTILRLLNIIRSLEDREAM